MPAVVVLRSAWFSYFGSFLLILFFFRDDVLIGRDWDIYGSRIDSSLCSICPLLPRCKMIEIPWHSDTPYLGTYAHLSAAGILHFSSKFHHALLLLPECVEEESINTRHSMRWIDQADTLSIDLRSSGCMKGVSSRS